MASKPTPDGVGVKGGGLIGDSSIEVGLRRLGRGVTGRGGMANVVSLAIVVVPSVDGDVGTVEGLLFRLFIDVFVVAVAFFTLV